MFVVGVINAMENPELILMINTFLLSLVGMTLSLVGFFLKDLYRDHKRLSEQVNTLHREVNSHVRWSQEVMQLNRKLSEQNKAQLEQLHQKQIHLLAKISSENSLSPRR